jgi:predicted DNA-binding transcriptional regulator YafY
VCRTGCVRAMPNAVSVGDDKKAFLSGRRRPDGDPSEAAARKIWLLVELLRNGRARFTHYLERHGRDYRSFQRDLQQLRQLGTSLGFKISKIADADKVVLESYDPKLRKLDDQRPALLNLIAEIGRAFGETVQRELGPIGTAEAAGQTFLHFNTPQLVAGSRVAKVYEALKSAWSAPGGHAYVRFRYKTAGAAAPAERRVDPHRVVIRNGRYYLIGYDSDRRGWRFFALDAFLTIPARAGTVTTNRIIPSDYASEDALGFIKSARTLVEVTVEFDASVSTAIASRVWQHDQQLQMLPGGRARLTVHAGDFEEVVRWVFGFAPDAKIVDPPQAVRLAHKLGVAVAANHIELSEVR